MLAAGDILALGDLFVGRLRFPHAQHPQRQGFAARLWSVLRREQLHAGPTELHLGDSGSSFMFAGDLNAASRLRRPRPGTVQQVIQVRLGLVLLDKHAAILGGSHHKEGSHLSAALQKGKHIGVTVSHMNPHLSARRWTHLLDGSCPDLAFTRPLAPLSGITRSDETNSA